VNWIKKVAGMGTLLGVALVGACGESNLVLGSDGAGASANGVLPNKEPSGDSFLTQITCDAHGACLTFPLPQDDAGNPTCRLLSAHLSSGCDCKAAGLTEASAQDISAAAANFGCGGNLMPCSDVCVCAIAPATGKDLEQCQTLTDPDGSATGWCYISADRGKSQALKLLQSCPLHQTNEIRFLGAAVPPPGEVVMLACSGSIPNSVGAAVGDPCISTDEYMATFRGYDVNEVNVETDASMCSSGICLMNHFQGRVSCPYGQAAGSSDCLVHGSDVPVSGAVQPQLVARQAAQAVICSCRCDGDGPGPYCTCPESMQCEHLVDDLHLSEPNLVGSYCIPKGTQYQAKSDPTLCTDSACGDAHPY